MLMIAGGTGITPMFQIIKSSVKDKNDKTKLALIYANVDESDICKPYTSSEPPTNVFSAQE
jgi:cytochrome-b5 reductase